MSKAKHVPKFSAWDQRPKDEQGKVSYSFKGILAGVIVFVIFLLIMVFMITGAITSFKWLFS